MCRFQSVGIQLIRVAYRLHMTCENDADNCVDIPVIDMRDNRWENWPGILNYGLLVGRQTIIALANRECLQEFTSQFNCQPEYDTVNFGQCANGIV